MNNAISRRLLLGGGGAMAGASLLPANASAGFSVGGTCKGLKPGKMASLYGPDPKDAHLIFNENPFGPSPKALQALAEASTQGAYYQWPAVQKLMAMIAEKNGVEPNQILITTGSSEILVSIALAYAQKGKTLGPDLFWDTTAKYAVRNGYGEIVRVPMKDGLEVDLPGMKAALTDEIGLVHIVNPNNPTGRLIPADELRAFTKEASKKATVLIDEAYIEISDDPEGNSMVDLVRAGHDVIIARTFSKIYGMAGLRVGYIITTPENAEALSSYMVTSPNVAGIAAAIASYNDEKFLAYSKSRIVEAREMITEATAAVGLNPLPSQTSFVFVDVKKDAEDFRAKMEEKRVLIRGVYGEYKTYSRVSAGFAEDVKRYVEALPHALA